LPHSSPNKVRNRVQSAVTLVVDQPLVEVMICTLETILNLINYHTAILDTHINFPLAMSVVVKEQRIFLLVSTSS
jgi:hypothetical protein